MPEEITPNDLYPAARNELKTLQADVQERVARHLAAALMLLEEDPELAHQHALSASRRAGRIPVAREFLAMTAYRTGDFALALRELRTYRRLSGRDTHVALMVECERGLGRPEKGIETGLAIDAKQLTTEQRVHLAIAMSGARLDMGQAQQALFELEIPELNPDRGFSWSPELFAAYAAVLEELGRGDEAAVWNERADRAALALEEHLGSHDELDVFEVVEMEFDGDDEHAAHETDADSDSPDGVGDAEQRGDGGDDNDSTPAAAGMPKDAEAGADESGDESGAAAGADESGAGETGAVEPAAEPEADADGEHLSFDAAVAAEVDELLAEAGIGVDSGDAGSSDADPRDDGEEGVR